MDHIREHGNLAPTVRYDDEADVLYLNFARAADAGDSELLPNDVLARYDDRDNIVGLTVLHAFKDQSVLDTRINDAILKSKMAID